MHPGILSAGFENGGHWLCPSRSFWPFWLGILGNLACLHDNLWWIWARITKFAPIMHLGIFSAGIENGGHLAIISTQETAFNLNISLVYWSRSAKGCYTSQTCSCLAKSLTQMNSVITWSVVTWYQMHPVQHSVTLLEYKSEFEPTKDTL